MRFPQKIKLEPSYDPAIPVLCIYLKNMKTLIYKGIYTSPFVAEKPRQKQT